MTTVVMIATNACAIVTVVTDLMTSIKTGCPNLDKLAVLPRYAVVA
jgi:hypothetical protein